MSVTPRILLVEHLDATGSSASDLRPRANLLKGLGAEVRMMTIATETADTDLQHGTAERRQTGIERVAEERGGDVVRKAAAQWRADAVVWVSATPGAGDAARSGEATSATRWTSWCWATPIPSGRRSRARPASHSACTSSGPQRARPRSRGCSTRASC
ncbi:MAG: hypothetical protein ACKOC6_01490, partial [bacterium]